MTLNAPNLATMLDQWNGHILDWALILAAVATITMALLELVKALLGVRPKYHKAGVKSWVVSSQTYEDLLMLTVGGDGPANALFDQPTNKMMGQIQAAANTALDFPQRYSSFFRFLTAQPGADEATSDGATWAAFCARIEHGEQLDPESPETSAEVSAATRARARLDHFVARRLDAFQTVTEYRWARGNQAISVLAATIFLLVLMRRAGSGLTFDTVVVALFGGMIAPFAKDVVTALSGLRTTRT